MSGRFRGRKEALAAQGCCEDQDQLRLRAATSRGLGSGCGRLSPQPESAGVRPVRRRAGANPHGATCRSGARCRWPEIDWVVPVLVQWVAELHQPGKHPAVWITPRRGWLKAGLPPGVPAAAAAAVMRTCYLDALSSLKNSLASQTLYERKRTEGKVHKQAIIALARRRTNTILVMFRDRTSTKNPYRRRSPSRLDTVTEIPTSRGSRACRCRRNDARSGSSGRSTCKYEHFSRCVFRILRPRRIRQPSSRLRFPRAWT